jgi:hypothetical protein
MINDFLDTLGMIMKQTLDRPSRNNFIGGSDARTIMGKDEKALHRLWRENRGEEAPADLSAVPWSFSEEGGCGEAHGPAPAQHARRRH